jgi:5,10-methenyltetrahydromethanopterin hydrogenase
MKKTSFKNNINAIKTITSKMPKTLNEAINFNEADDMQMMDRPMDDEMMGPEEDMSMDDPMGDEQGSGADKLLSDIRKMSINGLAQLADTPDDPNYEMLKKIFLMLDKAVTEKQEQREVMAKNPNAGRM